LLSYLTPGKPTQFRLCCYDFGRVERSANESRAKRGSHSIRVTRIVLRLWSMYISMYTFCLCQAISELNMTTMLSYIVCKYFIFLLPNNYKKQYYFNALNKYLNIRFANLFLLKGRLLLVLLHSLTNDLKTKSHQDCMEYSECDVQFSLCSLLRVIHLSHLSGIRPA
jgi:hypothetical protein